jgi:hypothetical protein
VNASRDGIITLIGDIIDKWSGIIDILIVDSIDRLIGINVCGRLITRRLVTSKVML